MRTSLLTVALVFFTFPVAAQDTDLTTNQGVQDAVMSSGSIFDWTPPAGQTIPNAPADTTTYMMTMPVMPGMPGPDPLVTSPYGGSLGSGNNVTTGPMGSAAIYVNPIGGGKVNIQMDMTTKLGYHWNSVTGFVYVSVYDPFTGKSAPLYATIITNFSLGADGRYDWKSMDLQVRPGSVVTATYCACGYGYSTWGGWNTPITWFTPPINDSMMCL